MTGQIADIYPLTWAQAGLLVSSLTETEPGLYVVQMRFALAGQLDRCRLELAWDALAARHDVLRTALVWDKTSKPVNVVMAQAKMPVTYLDFSGLDDTARSQAVQEFLEADRKIGFDLQQAPLSRVALLTFAGDEWEMVWTHHHVILDGWSTAHLMAELWRVYSGGPRLPAASSFRGYASALAADAERNRARNQTYWRERFTGGAARVSIDRPRSASAAETWTDRDLDIPDHQLERWIGAARRHGITLSTLYHAGWALTLRRNGLGPADLVLGTVADTRGTNGGGVVGLCIASVPLRVVFDDSPVSAWLRGIGVDRANSQEHAGVNLAEHRMWSRDSSDVPFRYLLAVEGYPHEALTNPDTGDDELTVRYLGVRESTQYALTAGVPAGSPRLKVTFDTRRITAPDATSLLGQWAAALDALSTCPSDQPLTALLGAMHSVSPCRTLPERISELARKHPDRLVFRDSSSHIVLGDLDRSSKRVASRLQLAGLRAGDCVGVLVDDSVAVAISILATLMAGGVVVPLDPRHPAPYRAAVISTAAVNLVLTSQPDARPEWASVRVLSVSELLAESSTKESLDSCSGRGWIAFVVHDAGSALRPVSVAHHHDMVMRTATMFGDMLGLTEGDEWLVTRPATGAAAPWEMWVAPLRGGCTIIAPGIQHDPVELARITGLDSVAVVSVTRREARQLAGVIRGRGRLVSATRTDTEVTLWSATGERIGRTDHGETRTGASASLMVDGIPVNPADIEAPLLDLPGVTSCIVRQQGDESLYAVVGTTAYKSVRDLTRILRSSMPETMVPEVALAESEAATITPRQLQFGPEIRRLWSQVLSVPEVPLDTPFFDLGGNSLLLFVVLSELKKQGWTTVEMTDLLAYPTVRSLSRRLCRSDDPTPAQSPASAHQGRNAIAARRERGRM